MFLALDAVGFLGRKKFIPPAVRPLTETGMTGPATTAGSALRAQLEVQQGQHGARSLDQAMQGDRLGQSQQGQPEQQEDNHGALGLRP